MAYAAGEQPWLGHFSSPGSTSCGAACGVQDHAHNVRSLRTVAPVIAGFHGPPGTLSIVDAEAYESAADDPFASFTFPARRFVTPAAGVLWFGAPNDRTACGGRGVPSGWHSAYC